MFKKKKKLKNIFALKKEKITFSKFSSCCHSISCQRSCEILVQHAHVTHKLMLCFDQFFHHRESFASHFLNLYIAEFLHRTTIASFHWRRVFTSLFKTFTSLFKLSTNLLLHFFKKKNN